MRNHTFSTSAQAAAVAKLELPPLMEAIFARRGLLPMSAALAARAALHPEAPALIDRTLDRPSADPEVWSWARLEEAIRSVSSDLRDRGATRGRRVTVEMQNGARHVIATQAAWRIGATVVPIDPRTPGGSRRQIARRLDAVRVSDAEALPTSSVDDLGHTVPECHSILHTGGTLGDPKLVEQRGAMWVRLDGPSRRLSDGYGLALGQSQMVVLPLSHGFGFGFAHEFGLGNGHCLVLLERFDPDGALEAIAAHQIQYMPAVPTMLGRMARAPGFRSVDLSSLEAVFHAGAPCPSEVKRAWIDRIGARRVFEGYGSTEVSIDCTIRGDEWLARPLSVGRPIGAEVAILDDAGHPVPDGSTGAIHVRPTQRGASHPRVLGHPSARDDLRSIGDLGYLDPDGFLCVVGRGALRLVCGGFTVVVEAVEAVLHEHPLIESVGVVALEDDDLGEVPCAVVQVRPGASLSLEALRAWCQGRLPPAEIPRAIHQVGEIPMTDLGKVDRRGLAESAFEASEHTAVPDGGR